MKHTRLILSILCCWSLISISPSLAGVEGNLTGSIQTDQRLRFDPQEFTRNETRLSLKLQGSLGDKYAYFGEMQFKGVRDLTADDQYQWETDLREGYLDLYKFFSDNLDLRIGKQIIAWGSER
jgi:hypothetical protein